MIWIANLLTTKLFTPPNYGFIGIFNEYRHFIAQTFFDIFGLVFPHKTIFLFLTKQAE